MTNEEAIKILSNHEMIDIMWDKADEALNMAIDALEQQPILDKIRAEIERERSFQRAMDEYDIATGLRKALEIIDNYKAESEVKE